MKGNNTMQQSLPLLDQEFDNTWQTDIEDFITTQRANV